MNSKAYQNQIDETLIENIYIASTFDIDVTRHLLKHHLEEAHGYEVEICDRKTFANKPSAIVAEQIEDKMSSSELVILILGTKYGSRPTDSELSYLHFELLLCYSLAKKNKRESIHPFLPFAHEDLMKAYTIVKSHPKFGKILKQYFKNCSGKLRDYQKLDRYFAQVRKNKLIYDNLVDISKFLVNEHGFDPGKNKLDPVKILYMIEPLKKDKYHINPFKDENSKNIGTTKKSFKL